MLEAFFIFNYKSCSKAFGALRKLPLGTALCAFTNVAVELSDFTFACSTADIVFTAVPRFSCGSAWSPFVRCFHWNAAVSYVAVFVPVVLQFQSLSDVCRPPCVLQDEIRVVDLFQSSFQ